MNLHHKLSGAFLIISVICLALLAACRKDQPLRVGFVAGLSGRVADLGIGGRNGAMLAIEQRNAAGGVNGRQVELLVRDDEQKPESAKRAVAELLAAKVEVIIGPMTSSMAMAVVPQANEAKVFMVSPTVTTQDLSGKDDYFYRVIASTREYAEKNARYSYGKLGHRTVAVIYDKDNSSYTEGWLGDFRRVYEQMGGRILALESFRSSEEGPFLPMVRRLVATGPEFILIIANAADSAQICQQIRKVDGKMPISMAEWGSTERFIELGGASVEGVVVAQFLDRANITPRYREFLRAYRQRFSQEPGFAGVAGYDAALLVMAAMEKRAGGQTLKEAVQTIDEFEGVQQRVKLDKFGDSNRNTFIATVRDGRFVTLE